DKSDIFIQQNSPDGGFLQSEGWRKFQAATGKKTFSISGDGFKANIIEHSLPVVGKYFYVPRGPVVCHPERSETEPKDLIRSLDKLEMTSSRSGMTELIKLAKENNINWVRIEPKDKQTLELVQELIPASSADKPAQKIRKAPHDMQPREIFIIDISKSEEELLSQMKSKTRYNIRLAQKKGVSLRITNKYETTNDKYIDEFVRLNKITAKRDRITTHPENYYRKMLETISDKNIKLYLAEYQGRIIAANIISFYTVRNSKINTSSGNSLATEMNNNISNGVYNGIATYLHGASDNEHRNVMAPYLLQWQAILDAKKAGCKKYDFGGVKTGGDKSWSGITRFKSGFSPNTKPTEFPGSYDIVLNSGKYTLYRFLQKIKSFM
ncbi:MAG TPA: peptidoglycan bridge formation glycyltransferase FemA/FemB family protein, partial [Candidatus Moranbacteria bacterium]|nr:peptidoglycan bridge formation glycyltransferase FemA/FemB family protein [Candidatus Moranbacteria bacterium]